MFETAAEAEHRRRIADAVVWCQDPAWNEDEAGSEDGDTCDIDPAMLVHRNVDADVWFSAHGSVLPY